jgi:hypothetical protein
MDTAVSERAGQFHRDHPICDVLGPDLTHLRLLVDQIALAQRQHTA